MTDILTSDLQQGYTEATGIKCQCFEHQSTSLNLSDSQRLKYTSEVEMRKGLQHGLIDKLDTFSLKLKQTGAPSVCIFGLNRVILQTSVGGYYKTPHQIKWTVPKTSMASLQIKKRACIAETSLRQEFKLFIRFHISVSQLSLMSFLCNRMAWV